MLARARRAARAPSAHNFPWGDDILASSYLRADGCGIVTCSETTVQRWLTSLPSCPCARHLAEVDNACSEPRPQQLPYNSSAKVEATRCDLVTLVHASASPAMPARCSNSLNHAMTNTVSREPGAAAAVFTPVKWSKEAFITSGALRAPAGTAGRPLPSLPAAGVPRATDSCGPPDPGGGRRPPGGGCMAGRLALRAGPGAVGGLGPVLTRRRCRKRFCARSSVDSTLHRRWAVVREGAARCRGHCAN